MKKIDKEFILSDSSLNCYSFRLLTSGYQLSEFARNPIGYYMHQRELGVLVRWEELAVKGDRVTGKPAINEDHVRGQQTINEVQKGFLNAASVGHVVVIEQSSEPSLMLPGQTGVTVTKWYNRECSLVDIPGNFNALSLYDKDGFALNLSAMAGNSLVNVSNSFNTKNLLNEALEDGIVSSDLYIQLVTDFKGNPGKLSSVIENLYQNKISLAYSHLSWNELDKAGVLAMIKKKDFPLFKSKFRQHFNTEYNKN